MPRKGVVVPDDPPSESNWIWGNHRGGGGAPLKDMDGTVVTNLRKVIKGAVEVDHHSPVERKSYDRRYENEQRDDYDRDYRDRENRGRFSHRDDRDQRDQGAASGSPKKFMSALRDMNSDPSERNMQKRKELEYQAALRDQIEENKRKKESEKKELEKTKQKEYDEYLRSQGRAPQQPSNARRSGEKNDPYEDEDRFGGSRKEAGKDVRRRDDDFEREHGRNGNDDVRDRERERARGRNSRRDFDSDDGDDSSFRRKGPAVINLEGRRGGRDDGDDWTAKDRRGGGGGAGGAPPRLSLERRVSPIAADHERGRGGRAPDKNEREVGREGRGDRRVAGDKEDREGRGGGGGSQERWVSKMEYDQLTALCDKLMTQQERLQDEIDSQARVISTGSGSAGRGKGVGLPRVAGLGGGRREPSVEAEPEPTRSKSMQQGRRTDAAEKGRRVAVANDRRPNSEQAMGHGSGLPAKKGAAVGRGRGGGGAPVPKVAFGGAINPTASAIDTKQRAGAALSKAGAAMVGAAATAGGAGRGAGRGQGSMGVGSGDASGRKPAPAHSPQRGGGGFAKLQQVAARGGPMVVTYDDEVVGAGGGGRSGGRSSMELNCESEHLRVGKDNSDIIGGDQLDRLLVQARRARVMN